jgi:hypothetical protein
MMIREKQMIKERKLVFLCFNSELYQIVEHKLLNTVDVFFRASAVYCNVNVLFSHGASLDVVFIPFGFLFLSLIFLFVQLPCCSSVCA